MLTIFGWNFEIEEQCKGVHCVDLGESFPTSIYFQKSASIHPRTSPSKFGRKFDSIFIRLLALNPVSLLSQGHPNLGDLYTESGQTLQGSFSAVSKPNFASEYALESSRRDLHNALLCTVLNAQNFRQKSLKILLILSPNFAKFANFREILPKFCSKWKRVRCRSFWIRPSTRTWNFNATFLWRNPA